MERKNPLLFEKGGAFNPGWLLFMLFALESVFVIASVVAIAWRTTNPWAPIATLCFLAAAMLITAIIVVPLAKATLLATSPTIRAGITTLGGSVDRPSPDTSSDVG